MSAGTYDPFAIERPKIRVGEHGEWELGDITDARHAKIVEWHSEWDKLSSSDAATMADMARVCGQLCEAACVNGEGITDLLLSLVDEEKHGDSALGARACGGLVNFVMGWLAGEESAGNV